jgi:hypothetical protein
MLKQAGVWNVRCHIYVLTVSCGWYDKIYAYIVQVTGDSLGLNGELGVV